jgi:NAD-dependent deacetylase
MAKHIDLPAHHDRGGCHRGTPAEQLACLDGWAHRRDQVIDYYDERRMATAPVLPSVAHEALSRMQHALSAKRCTLVTENIDGMLLKASAEQVVELHGSLFRLQCEADRSHPQPGVFGPQPPDARCKLCGAPMRPAVVWPGEAPYRLDEVLAAVRSCDVFLAVGTSAASEAARTLIDEAHASGARTIAINPAPEGGPFDETFAVPAEQAVPELVARWLGDPG